jgi:hypothetical protein
VDLQTVGGTPGANIWQRPLTALPEGRFWGEDDALCRSHRYETFDEALPGGVARLWRKWQVAPEVDTRPRHTELKLACVEEPEWGCASHQQVGMWRETYVHALEPCRSSKPLSGGKQAYMPTMQSVKDSKGENRPRSALH